MNATVAKSETGYRLSRAELRRRWEQLDRRSGRRRDPVQGRAQREGRDPLVRRRRGPPTARHGFLQGVCDSRARAASGPRARRLRSAPSRPISACGVPDVVWASADVHASARDASESSASRRIFASRCCRRRIHASRDGRENRGLSRRRRKRSLGRRRGRRSGDPHAARGRVSASTLGFELRVARRLARGLARRLAARPAAEVHDLGAVRQHGALQRAAGLAALQRPDDDS